ncbi:MAG TPA: SDR family NAD(P)-dependent oxidoreductase [Alphaproteobacteria bacterium]|nr:SDR family NAD(P)-dependent oxidoreductase [Alphaproteobacteria bacterium]
MAILVTGAAGFIGFHVARALLEREEEVVGLDDLNDYYDVALKERRRAILEQRPKFTFNKADIADRQAIAALFARHPAIDRIVHLAAQAGVRHSLIDPYSYVHSNLLGQVTMFEAARAAGSIGHFVYASSSSVYGDSTRLPFGLDDPADRPRSLYGATKRSGEMIARSYAAMFALPVTGLRFFTVYGPWGRPDMSAYIFTKDILAGRPITLFNQGEMKRDFTYIDDIVAGVLAALDRPPAADESGAPHRLYNLGNHRSEPLRRFVQLIERACGRKAEIRYAPMQPGDVAETYADIEASQRDLGFEPTTPIDEGIPRFVKWFKEYHGV